MCIAELLALELEYYIKCFKLSCFGMPRGVEMNMAGIRNHSQRPCKYFSGFLICGGYLENSRVELVPFYKSIRDAIPME